MLERHWLKVATRTMMQFPGAKLMFILQKGCSIRDENRINFAKFGVGSVPVDSIPVIMDANFNLVCQKLLSVKLNKPLCFSCNNCKNQYNHAWMNTSLPTEMSEFSHSTVTALVRNCKDQPVFNTHKIFRSISQYFHEYCLKQSVPASVYLLFAQIADYRSLWSSFAWNCLSCLKLMDWSILLSFDGVLY